MGRSYGRSGLEVPRKVPGTGLLLIALIDLVLAALALDGFSLSTSRPASPADVAYLGTQWSKLTFGAAWLAAFNIFALGLAIVIRLQRQHEVHLFVAQEITAAIDDPWEAK